jgi:hypothetical protein
LTLISPSFSLVYLLLVNHLKEDPLLLPFECCLLIWQSLLLIAWRIFESSCPIDLLLICEMIFRIVAQTKLLQIVFQIWPQISVMNHLLQTTYPLHLAIYWPQNPPHSLLMHHFQVIYLTLPDLQVILRHPQQLLLLLEADLPLLIFLLHLIFLPHL